jgi:hypothetical protein
VETQFPDDSLDAPDRRAFLLAAAAAIDQAHANLAPGQPITETPEGALARALADDTVEFAGTPVWYHITDQDFLSRKMPVPVNFTELTQRFSFYWMYCPIALFPQRNWGFNRLDVILQLNPTEIKPEFRPKAYQILPDKKFQQLLELSDSLDVRLNENFQFSAQASPQKVTSAIGSVGAGAGIDAKGAGSMGLVVGPFTYSIKKAQIDHTPVGMEMVRWRIEGAKFFQEDSPELIVVVQVPKGTGEVDVAAALEARRYFNYGAAGLQDVVKRLTEKFRKFFEDGMPLKHQVRWNFPANE